MKVHNDIPAILHGLRERGLTIAFAESCTGGRLAADFTTVSGSSEVVKGSAVCYMTAAKRKVLGLKDVNESNVVSEETAQKMAVAALELFDADIGVGTTGYLDGDDPHAWFAVIAQGVARSTWSRVDFPKNSPREVNREIVIRAVMSWLTLFAKPLPKQASKQASNE